jgi:hypothetical protein
MASAAVALADSEKSREDFKMILTQQIRGMLSVFSNLKTICHQLKLMSSSAVNK